MNAIVFVRDVDEENEDIFYIFLVNINTLSLISPKTKQIVGKLKSRYGNQVSLFDENYGFKDGIKINLERMDCRKYDRKNRFKLEIQERVCPVLN